MEANRSLLFVPGGSERKIAKAQSGPRCASGAATRLRSGIRRHVDT